MAVGAFMEISRFWKKRWEFKGQRRCGRRLNRSNPFSGKGKMSEGLAGRLCIGQARGWPAILKQRPAFSPMGACAIGVSIYTFRFSQRRFFSLPLVGREKVRPLHSPCPHA